MDKDQIIADIYSDMSTMIDAYLKNRSFDFTLLGEIIRISMESLDEFNAEFGNPFTSPKKSEVAKDLVIFILDDLAYKNRIDAKFKSEIVLSLDILYPILFRLIIMADKGEFNLKHLNKQYSEKCCICQ